MSDTRQQTDYHKLVGRIDEDYYFCDYIFEDGSFKGATATVVRPVFKDESEDVQEFINRIANRKAERQAKRREVMASDSGVKVGDIFSCNWGYDETHIDYGVVRSINGRRAVIEDLTGMPGSNQGDKFTKIIQGTAQSPYISLTSYANAYKTTLEKARANRVQNDVFYTGNYR